MRNFCKRFLYLVMADGLGWLFVSLLMGFVLNVRLLLGRQQQQHVLLWSADALCSAKPRRDHKVRSGADLVADGETPLTPVSSGAVQSRCRLPPLISQNLMEGLLVPGYRRKNGNWFIKYHRKYFAAVSDVYDVHSQHSFIHRNNHHFYY